MSNFNNELDVPKPWVEDLLSELADTHHAMYTCDSHGTFRRTVNDKRRAFLEDVLGLEDVEYTVCEHCQTFKLLENTDNWPYRWACDECEPEETA